MMTHGQQWAACVRCFLPAGMTHFLSCLLPSPATYLLSPVHFSRSDSRQLGMCAGTWRRQWWRGDGSSSSSKYIVQQHSRAQRQTNTYTEAAYGPGILPHPVQPPSFPFLFPLPLTPSPSLLPASPAPFHSLPARLRSPLPFAPCIGTVVYLPGRTAYHVPAPFSVMIYWLPPSATLEAPAFNWRTLYTTVADTHQPGLYHSA